VDMDVIVMQHEQLDRC